MTNIVKGAVLSFYSGVYYGELARAHKGVGIGLVFILTLLTTAFFFLAIMLGGEFANLRELIASLPEQAESLPAITLQDGKLSIDKPVPYKIDFGAAPDNLWIIIDTNYQITDINALEKFMRDQKVFILITQDKLVSRNVSKRRDEPLQSDNSLEIRDLKDSKPFVITHEKWHSLADTVTKWGIPMLLTMMLLLMGLAILIGNLFATLLTALAVMMLGIITHVGLEFTAAARLAAAARIPIVVLSALPTSIGHPPLSGLAGWGLWGIYIVFAVVAVRLHGGSRAQ